MAGTRRDSEQSEHGGRSGGVLTVITRHDALCADVALRLPPLGLEIRAASIVRGIEGTGCTFDGTALSLGDPYVSARHAEIFRRGAVDVLRDTSTQGTFVNGVQVEGERVLGDGDCIEIGRTLLLYRELPSRLLEGAAVRRLGPTRTLSPETLHVVAQLDLAAATSHPVLLLGETGAGKEVAARHVHQVSGRGGPFVAIDCGALPATLFEADLFGVARGAHSEAKQAREGIIRSAQKGTLFFDEIGNMPLESQAKLLRVLDDGMVRPVGGDRAVQVDVRWIAGTNVDVRDPGAAFRRDLFHRLGGLVVEIPPLRRRREDLGILAAHILAQAGVREARMTKRAARALFFGPLVGNVRELRQTLLRAVTLADGGRIDLEHLALEGPARGGEGPASMVEAASEAPAPSAPRTMRARKPPRERIERALAESGGVQEHAARALGTNERQLRRWMDEWGIPRSRSR